MPKALRSIGGIFLAMGLFAAAIGSWSIWSDHEFAANGAQATGKVVDFERDRVRSSNSRRYRTMYAPIVEFQDNNGEKHSFVGQVGSTSPAFSIGERVNVIYDPWSPDEAIIDGFRSRHKLPIIFIGLGLLFAGIGAVLVNIILRRQRLTKLLRESGIRVQAKYVNCTLYRRIKVGRRSPWIVSVQGTHPTTGQSMNFESEPVWKDLSARLKGKTVPVLVDPANPRRYHVDLSQWVSEDEFA